MVLATHGWGDLHRLLDETERPVLVVAGEKFSDKIGTLRTSRMLFGDASAALVVGPATSSAPPDINDTRRLTISKVQRPTTISTLRLRLVQNAGVQQLYERLDGSAAL